MDCQFVINSLKLRMRIFRLLVKFFKGGFKFSVLSFVRRGGKNAAHTLAKHAPYDCLIWCTPDLFITTIDVLGISLSLYI